MTLHVLGKKKAAPASHTLQFNERTRLRTLSALRTGQHNLLCNDARLSYIELGDLISDYTGWDLDTVLDSVEAQLYCSALVLLPTGETRTYWATESRYDYNGGARRDKVQIDLGQGSIGVGEITSFINMSTGIDDTRQAVIIRWMSKSSLSTVRDDHDRAMCDFPLSMNHCLWQWSDSRRRVSFRVRGFGIRSVRQNLWSHVHKDDRQRVIDSEIRARYDIIGIDSIIGHANIHEDPSTGHMLQTLQIV